jgi:DNA-binding MarR family transcriptional regulator
VAARSDLAASMAPVTKALAQMEEAIARRRGLTMWRYAVLVAVRDEPGSNQAQIAARIGYDKNRIVADLDALEADGLVARTPAATDRRHNHLTLTPEGSALADELQAEVHAAEDALLDALPATDRRAIRRSLAALRSRVAEGTWLAPYLGETG